MSTDSAENGVYLSEVRLTAFKSFRDEVLRLSPLTVLIGRNGSGKSNALDAIEVLARLAKGEFIRDVLEGDHRAGAAVRGGAAGCAPHGLDEFSIGCTVASSIGLIDLDVTVKVSPRVEIVKSEIASNGRRLPSSMPNRRETSFLEQAVLLSAVGPLDPDQAPAWLRLLTALSGVF
jgi:hypothetical protein